MKMEAAGSSETLSMNNNKKGCKWKHRWSALRQKKPIASTRSD
jgi:hypothetical protein